MAASKELGTETERLLISSGSTAPCGSTSDEVAADIEDIASSRTQVRLVGIYPVLPEPEKKTSAFLFHMVFFSFSTFLCVS